MTEITLKKRYPHSRSEDITDAFMRGYAKGKADRPHGEWIGEADGYADGEFVYDTWYCSNCDYVVDDDEPPTWNYCPSCGARMVKEANK